MNDQNGRYARLRYTATGALAALAVLGVIAGTVALAANPHTKTHGHAATATGRATKTPTSPVPDKTRAPQAAVNHQPFFNAIQQLVDNGTITATEGRAVDREIRVGSFDPRALASSGFTQTQLHAVEQTLSNTKRALAAAAPPPVRGKNGTPGAGSDQRFLTAVQRLVDDGTINDTQGRAVDREIRAGSFDPRALASSGFTRTQLQAVEQTLSNTKRAIARNVR